MVPREACPQCGSTWFKRNGHIYTGKQNHRGKLCGRAFVLHPENPVITEEQRTLIERLLLERISLRGICRAVGVGLQWLLQFMAAQFREAPDHLYADPPSGTPAVILQRLEAELDEIWSFVGKKANRHWVWIAMDATTRQIIAFYVGDRSGQSAQALWEKIPAVYQEHAVFYTDHYAVYTGVIPSPQHRAISKLARTTNHVERFNCTLRQQVSRLLRATLSFSKKLANHIGAIKYFICDYNLTNICSIARIALPKFATEPHAYKVRPESKQHISRPPSEYLKKLYFNSIVYQEPSLENLVRYAGSDHVLLGADYPFDMGEVDPVGFIHQLKSVSQAEREDARR